MKKMFAFILGLPLAMGGVAYKAQPYVSGAGFAAARTVQGVASGVIKTAPRSGAMFGRTAVRQAGGLAAGIGASIVAEKVYRAATDGGDIVTTVQAAEPQEPVKSRRRSVALADPDKLY